MTPSDQLDDLEGRLRVALAHALRRAIAQDPAWRSFEASLQHGDQSLGSAQKGVSSFLPEAPREEGGDPA